MKNLYKIHNEGLLYSVTQLDVSDVEIDITYPKRIHSAVAPELEIMQVIKGIDFDYNNVIVLFGLRNIKLVAEIAKRMTEWSHLVIFEYQEQGDFILEADSETMETVLQSRTSVFICNNINDAAHKFSRLLDHIDVLASMGRVQIFNSPYMRSMFPEFIQEMTMYIYENTNMNIYGVGNDVYDTLRGIGNHINNYIKTHKSPRIKLFKDLYLNQPGFVVSAGPSLDKNLEYLKQIEGKGLIFAVDTVAQKLYDNGIIPDAISTIERDKIVYHKFYKEKDIHSNTVFIGPSVVDSRILDECEKSLIIHRFGDTVSRKISEIMKDDVLEIGTNCSHVAFGLLKYMGCNPIVFVGQDLAFSREGKKYFDDEQLQRHISSFEQADVRHVPANDGGMLVTLKGYLDTKLWFEEQIKNDQTPNRAYINATEGGAKIYGTEYRTLRDVVSAYCSNEVKPFAKSFDEKNLIREEIDAFEFIRFFNTGIEEIERTKEQLEKEDSINETYRLELVEDIFDRLIDNNRQLFFTTSSQLLWIIQSMNFAYNVRMRDFPARNHSVEQQKVMLDITHEFLMDLIKVMLYVKQEFELYIKVLTHNMKGEEHVEAKN